jgi:excinuclease ABC subunit C
MDEAPPSIDEQTKPAGGELSERLARLPRRPGVYRFLNRAGATVYVGKAKCLRDRVRSYFRPRAAHPPHIERMVREVADLDVIVVDTEKEALLLEANLIKRERPRFNVVLRDDKSFPYVKLTVRDTYARASLVRRARVDGSLYVGPFLPASGAHRTLKTLQRHFRVATCKEVFDGKRRPCLYYHLDQCLAPCAGKTDPDEYGRAVADARLFLDGRHRELDRILEQRMEQASGGQEYEKAARYRDTLRTVRSLAVKQHVTSAGLEEQDFFAHHAEGDRVGLQLFLVREGKIQARREFTMEGVGFEADAFYAAVIAQYYAETDPPPQIYLPELPSRCELLETWLSERRGGRVRMHVPRRGPKRRLLDLVGKNAALAFDARFRTAATHVVEVLGALAETLGLDEPPYRIECFDISNTQGTDSVASMVVWEGGKPRKSAYRSFTIRGVQGADDTASIAEAVTRRYRRLVAEDRPLPDLVLLDGGKGQLGAAVAALTRIGLPMMPVAAIAKRQEEIFLEARAEPVSLGRDSPVLQLIQRMRDEAHRFAVSRHRRRRARRTLRTELTEVPGIGPVKARRLLTEFGSLEGVRRAGEEELARAVGRTAAAAIVARFHGREGG